MNILMKAAVGLAVLGAGGFAIHMAHAADPVPAVQTQVGGIVIPPVLEAQIRAMARAQAPEGSDPAAAELHVMTLIHAHLAEAARDPSAVSHANQVMAAAVNGDKDALGHVHEMLKAIVGGDHH